MPLSICEDCFNYHHTGDATSFDYHYSGEESQKRWEEVEQALKKFVPPNHSIQSVPDEDGDHCIYFSNASCDCCGEKSGYRYDVLVVDLDDFDSSYLEDCIDPDGYLEIPAEVLVEVRNDQ